MRSPLFGAWNRAYRTTGNASLEKGLSEKLDAGPPA
jgi:hypothetical protein